MDFQWNLTRSPEIRFNGDKLVEMHAQLTTPKAARTALIVNQTVGDDWAADQHKLGGAL
jgi:hypothetical protein